MTTFAEQLAQTLKLSARESLRLQAHEQRLRTLDFVALEAEGARLHAAGDAAGATLASALIEERVAAATPPTGPTPEAVEAASAEWRAADLELSRKRRELEARACNVNLSAAAREVAQDELRALPREAVYKPPI